MSESTGVRDHLITVQCRIAELARVYNGGELEIGDEVMIPWGEVDAILWAEMGVSRLEASVERHRSPEFLRNHLGLNRTGPQQT